jgi:hypothetical protein
MSLGQMMASNTPATVIHIAFLPSRPPMLAPLLPLAGLAGVVLVAALELPVEAEAEVPVTLVALVVAADDAGGIDCRLCVMDVGLPDDAPDPVRVPVAVAVDALVLGDVWAVDL